MVALSLGACAQTNKAWEPQIEKTQVVIDTTPEAVISWLDASGYKNSLITGNRTEDCADDHTILGYGVIVQKFDESGRPKAASARVCQDFDGNFSIEFDTKV